MPPRKSLLVLGMNAVIVSTASDDVGIYEPAFLLERLDGGRARFLVGWEEEVTARNTEGLPATHPYNLTPEEAARKGYMLRCDRLSSFVTAVQLAERGAASEAGELWERIKAQRSFGNDSRTAALRANPRLLLGRCLYEYLSGRTREESSDLPYVYDKLVMLQKEFPGLFSEDLAKFEQHQRSRFVQDLGLAVGATKPPDGSVEALLVDWGNRAGRFRHLGYFDDQNVNANRPAREIFRQGTAVVPDLARLVGDRRLTRHLRGGEMLRPVGNKRLGELAEWLLRDMIGSERIESVQTVPHGEEGERVFFEGAAVTRTSAGVARFHDVPLWILGEKYPRSLLARCAKMPKDAMPDVPMHALAEAVARSKLPRNEKRDALASLCQRLSDFRRQPPVLFWLAQFDEQRCIALLRPILARLPSDVNEAYWSCEVVDFTGVIMQLRDDDIWTQYLGAAKRAAIGLRMEMMGHMDFGHILGADKDRMLAFLAAFLDDAAVRDITVDPVKYDGPYAAFTFQKIEVRDFAAMKIAFILDLDDGPKKSWTTEQWARLRTKVRAILKERQSRHLDEQRGHH